VRRLLPPVPGVFGLGSAAATIRRDWPVRREQALALTELWEGEDSRQFFTEAVDADFAWGENGGIICVYRMYVPLMGSPAGGIVALLDSPDWRRSNDVLIRFLGLDEADELTVSTLLARLADSASLLSRAPRVTHD
jgi:hypothetical protein